MEDLFGTRTEKNLLAAFAGESQARNKYTFFASMARKEGYNKIAEIFEESAKNEMAHAKIFLKHLKGINSTIDNLKDAATGENQEWTTIYKDFATIAYSEGFSKIAREFEEIAEIEKQHELRFSNLYDDLVNNKVFKKDDKVYWKCRNCGHIHLACEAPKICPVCKHPQSYFEEKCC